MKRILAATGAIIFWTATSWAVPQSMTYQGTLKQKGLPVTGVVAMQFSFVNADGTAIPAVLPISTNVVVTNGLFAVQLPIPQNVNWAQLNPAIQVFVGSQQLSPSQTINSNLYAIVSQTVVDGAISQAKLDSNVQAQFVPSGAILPYAGPVSPSGWLLCDGRSYSISAFPTLFAVIGTYWGGDGTTIFNVPDLRGRAIMGAGQGNGLTNRSLGQLAGAETHTLTVQEMPAHNHPAISVVTDPGHSHQPVSSPGSGGPALPNYTIPGAFPATAVNGIRTSVETTGITVQTTVGNAGGDSLGNAVPISVVPPSAIMNYIIKI